MTEEYVKVLHLRSSMDMGKRVSNRTYCGMGSSRRKRGKHPLYNVTEYAALVTCKRCLEKMRRVKMGDL